MLCEFELGRMVKDLPAVDVMLSNARFERRRAPWELSVAFPEATESGDYDVEANERVQKSMHCATFVVELIGRYSSTTDEAVTDASHCLLDLSRDVADTIWVAQSTQGFAGAVPKIIRQELEVDGIARDADLARKQGGGTIFVGLPLPMYEDVRRAVEEDVRPSVASTLLAQATRWGLAEQFASKSAALLLAATACEVALKSIISLDPRDYLGTLVNVLVPEGKQAPLSPGVLLEHVVPLTIGRSIKDDLPDIVTRYKELTKLRNHIVHTGCQIDQDAFWPHLNTARQLLVWIDDRTSESLES